MGKVFGEDEFDSFEDMLSELTGTHPRVRLFASVAVDGRDNVVGGAVWEYFLESKCFIYSFLLLDSAYKSKGLGRKIANRMWREIRLRKEGVVQTEAFLLRCTIDAITMRKTPWILRPVFMFENGTLQVGYQSLNFGNLRWRRMPRTFLARTRRHETWRS